MQTDSFRRTNSVLRHIGSEASLVRGSESTFPHPKMRKNQCKLVLFRFAVECRTSTTVGERMQTDSLRRTNDVLRHIGSDASLVRGSESTFPHPKTRKWLSH